jgi:hypothetical protein
MEVMTTSGLQSIAASVGSAAPDGWGMWIGERGALRPVRRLVYIGEAVMQQETYAEEWYWAVGQSLPPGVSAGLSSLQQVLALNDIWLEKETVINGMPAFHVVAESNVRVFTPASLAPGSPLSLARARYDLFLSKEHYHPLRFMMDLNYKSLSAVTRLSEDPTGAMVFIVKGIAWDYCYNIPGPGYRVPPFEPYCSDQ